MADALSMPCRPLIIPRTSPWGLSTKQHGRNHLHAPVRSIDGSLYDFNHARLDIANPIA